jgi:hypothetical protein
MHVRNDLGYGGFIKRNKSTCCQFNDSFYIFPDEITELVCSYCSPELIRLLNRRYKLLMDNYYSKNGIVLTVSQKLLYRYLATWPISFNISVVKSCKFETIFYTKSSGKKTVYNNNKDKTTKVNNEHLLYFPLINNLSAYSNAGIYLPNPQVIIYYLKKHYLYKTQHFRRNSLKATFDHYCQQIANCFNKKELIASLCNDYSKMYFLLQEL